MQVFFEKNLKISKSSEIRILLAFFASYGMIKQTNVLRKTEIRSKKKEKKIRIEKEKTNETVQRSHF